MIDDTETFETHRPALLALAYRMLGDLGRAEDAVQEAWVRWRQRSLAVDSPKAFLLTTVTRLCLDELGSARARREESRSDRLPEPVDLDESGLGRIELLDEISMAFLVLLQRLTPAERAVFLLHEAFDLSHDEIAALLGKNAIACRQLLARARAHVAVEKRALQTSREEHQRLLGAFVRAVVGGEEDQLIGLLAEDAVFIADAGPEGGRFGRLRNVRHPLVGRDKIAAVTRAFAREQLSVKAALQQRELNGQPAVIALREGRAVAALILSVADGQIRRVFLQLDPERLKHIGPLH